MADVLKVLMMGGQRAGKTSMLAGLIDTMTRGTVKDIISVSDVTQNQQARQKLKNSIISLKLSLRMSEQRNFLIDEGKSGAFEDYILQFSIPKTESKMDILFSDVSGEYFDMGRTHDAEVREKISSYDVFLVAIDTPNLMEAANPDNRLCNESVNNSYNHVNDIYNFLTGLDDKQGADAKLVIFVPLKCEKWVKEGHVDQVLQRVKTVYGPTIDALSHYTNVEVDILPIQTVGNIVFHEQTKPMLCLTNGANPRKCAVINNKTQVRFEDGSIEDLNLQKHSFMPDPEAVIREHSSLIVPNSWYTTVGREYKPRNCDQLAYYILQFYLRKVLFAKDVEHLRERKNKWKWGKRIAMGVSLLFGLAGVLTTYLSSKYLEKKFGTITTEQMLALARKLEEGNYLKRNTDGIETLKASILPDLQMNRV